MDTGFPGDRDQALAKAGSDSSTSEQPLASSNELGGTDHPPMGAQDETAGTAGRSGWGSAEDSNPAVRQLEGIIQSLTDYARPALREIAARAAELAAKAGEAAGPVAQRAAGATGEVGSRLAARSREIASDLRSEQAREADETEL
jgi:hypothetical protein